MNKIADWIGLDNLLFVVVICVLIGVMLLVRTGG